MTTVADATVNSGSELTAWYRELAPNEKRTFWACFGGWALDALDVAGTGVQGPRRHWLLCALQADR
jgi:hypothetical protein